MVNIHIYPLSQLFCYFQPYLKDFMSMTASSMRDVLSKNHETKIFLHLNNFIYGGIFKMSYILKLSTKYYFVLTLTRCISYEKR